MEILLPLVSEEENTEAFLYTFSLPGSLLAFHNSKTNFHFESSNSRPSGLTSSNPLPSSTLKEIKLTLDNHRTWWLQVKDLPEGMPTDKPELVPRHKIKRAVFVLWWSVPHPAPCGLLCHETHLKVERDTTAEKRMRKTRHSQQALWLSLRFT